MTTILPLMDRIKVLFRGLRDDKRFALNKTCNDEVEMPPSPIQTGRRQVVGPTKIGACSDALRKGLEAPW